MTLGGCWSVGPWRMLAGRNLSLGWCVEGVGAGLLTDGEAMTSASDLEFVAFVQDASPRLLRTSWFVCGDPVQAEDLVQAALEKVYLRWRRIDRGAATAYARKILFNQH